MIYYLFIIVFVEILQIPDMLCMLFFFYHKSVNILCLL